MPESVEHAPLIERIRVRLEHALAPQRLDIVDESAAHAGHPGAMRGGGHYRVYLVSDRFAGLPRVARHRLVYHAVEDLMQREIHALALTLVTAAEVAGTGSQTIS
jgi:BolA family transcriptional regulator, general stress-responsive regulator